MSPYLARVRSPLHQFDGRLIVVLGDAPKSDFKLPDDQLNDGAGPEDTKVIQFVGEPVLAKLKDGTVRKTWFGTGRAAALVRVS